MGCSSISSKGSFTTEELKEFVYGDGSDTLIAGTGGIGVLAGSLGFKGGRGRAVFFLVIFGVGGRSDTLDGLPFCAIVFNDAGLDFDGRTIVEILESRDSRRAVGFGGWIGLAAAFAAGAVPSALEAASYGDAKGSRFTVLICGTQLVSGL